MSLQTRNDDDDPPGEDQRRWLSAAADGDADAVGKACRAWREDGSARGTWHTYHLIGDVMRSNELAAAPTRDAAFLNQLRTALAAEPVILAPSPAPVAVRARAQWLMPAAVAAGFVVVAGVLVVSRVGGPQPEVAGTLAAASGPPGPGALTRAGLGTYAPLPQTQGDRTVIRDARLDEYLRAHQSARGGIAVAVPGGALRRVEAELPAGESR